MGQVYFILVLYSYAAHLRSSTYHALPLTSRAKASQIAHPSGGGGRLPSESGRPAARDNVIDQEMERLRAEEAQFQWE